MLSVKHSWHRKWQVQCNQSYRMLGVLREMVVGVVLRGLGPGLTTIRRVLRGLGPRNNLGQWTSSSFFDFNASSTYEVAQMEPVCEFVCEFVCVSSWVAHHQTRATLLQTSTHAHVHTMACASICKKRSKTNVFTNACTPAIHYVCMNCMQNIHLVSRVNCMQSLQYVFFCGHTRFFLMATHGPQQKKSK